MSRQASRGSISSSGSFGADRSSPGPAGNSNLGTISDSPAPPQHHNPGHGGGGSGSSARRGGDLSVTGGMGWGLSLTNSGTYTSSRPRKFALPLTPVDDMAHRVVRGVLVKRKRLRAARRAAELVKSDEMVNAVRDAEAAAVAARAKAEEAEAELAEKRRVLADVTKRREERMKLIDSEFEGVLEERLRKVEREFEGKIRDVMSRELVVEEVKVEDVEREMGIVDEEEEEEEEEDGEAKEGEATEVNNGKKGEDGADGGGVDADTGEPKAKKIKTDGQESAKASGKDKDKDKEGGEDEEDGEIAEEPPARKMLESERKDEELTKAKSDLDGLNQAKSQMIWLLKQVITAENKRKMELKKKEKEAGEKEDGK